MLHILYSNLLLEIILDEMCCRIWHSAVAHDGKITSILSLKHKIKHLQNILFVKKPEIPVLFIYFSFFKHEMVTLPELSEHKKFTKCPFV